MYGLVRGMTDETARVHRGYWWRGGVAAHCARAAISKGLSRWTARNRWGVWGRRRTPKDNLEGLAARGFIEGRNLVFDVRWGEGRYERLSELAAALKATDADVIVTFGYPAALAAKVAAKGVPIVVTGSGDPVATGLAEDLRDRAAM